MVEIYNYSTSTPGVTYDIIQDTRLSSLSLPQELIQRFHSRNPVTATLLITEREMTSSSLPSLYLHSLVGCAVTRCFPVLLAFVVFFDSALVLSSRFVDDSSISRQHTHSTWHQGILLFHSSPSHTPYCASQWVARKASNRLALRTKLNVPLLQRNGKRTSAKRSNRCDNGATILILPDTSITRRQILFRLRLLRLFLI